ncbi:cysteine-rich motor neuron 1 protein-like [Gigantopelta aegis]|uniref:cysteine-rich motor neuron 1 protein-like n=1 Tax=Gigantopelta aegis TaxID=1735272 RepID=UPI001B88A258|nr:cysteine-rich motor neuron 1 protein-like [Gigantopelta aegis]
MLSYILFALTWTCGLGVPITPPISSNTSQPLSPNTTPPLPPNCERDGVIYMIGEDVPYPGLCDRCRCTDGYILCWYIGEPTPMCYNPVYRGENACPKHTCPENNCRTPHGHVIVGSESKYFQDDGYCQCPERRFLQRQWKPENGEAICFGPIIPPPTTITPPPTTTTPPPTIRLPPTTIPPTTPIA